MKIKVISLFYHKAVHNKKWKLIFQIYKLCFFRLYVWEYDNL